MCKAAPKGVRAGLKGGAGREAQLPSAPEARRRCNEILADLRDVALRAAMVLIAAMRLYMRTSNYLERLNREIERHACFVGVFPSKASAIRLIGSVLTEENECSSTQRKSYYGSNLRAAPAGGGRARKDSAQPEGHGEGVKQGTRQRFYTRIRT